MRRLFDWLVGAADDVPILPPDIQRRVDRDKELRAWLDAFIRSEGRLPSPTELWELSPPPVEVLGEDDGDEELPFIVIELEAVYG